MKNPVCIGRIICLLMIMILFPSIVESQSARQRALKLYPEKIHDLIKDLHSDDVRFNAIHARDAILFYSSEEFKKNPLVIAALEKALDSDDWQQRQIVADILRHLDLYEKKYQPTPRLIEVTIEGLRDDPLPNMYKGGCIWVFNATTGMNYLLAYPTLGTELLEKALDSDDAQQRFLAALILGSTGRKRQMKRIAEILIPHLRDDKAWNNACMAVYALYRLGNEVIPFIAPFKDDKDRQMREAVELILRDLENPPKDHNEKWKRRHLHHLSLHLDPAIDRAWYCVPSHWPEGTGEN